MIMDESLRVLLVSEFLKRIGPEDITHQSMSRRFSESVDLSFGERISFDATKQGA